MECLTPDFGGHDELVHRVARSGLDVYAHNVETVERLQGRVRDRRAGYAQSLRVLEAAKEAQPGLFTKTSIMLGCGEREEEVEQTLRDLGTAGCDVVTLGQYLRPSKGHMPIHRYVEPAEFDRLREQAEGMGFAYVASGPLVRSSYRAGGACACGEARAVTADSFTRLPVLVVTCRIFHEVHAAGKARGGCRRLMSPAPPSNPRARFLLCATRGLALLRCSWHDVADSSAPGRLWGPRASPTSTRVQELR